MTRPSTAFKQPVRKQISTQEQAFLREVAFARLDATVDKESLQHVCGSFWDLCLWEKQRASTIDTKAAGLLGLSSVASAIVTAVTPGSSAIALVTGAVGFYLFAAILAAIALLVANYGTFIDGDVFDALHAHHTPVGKLPPFTDHDPFNCYLRETTMQRWLVYRWYGTENDAKAKWLLRSQVSSVIAVALLFGAVFHRMTCA